MDPNVNLAALGLELPPPRKPAHKFVPARRCGNLLYISGQTAMKDGNPMYPGLVGQDVTAKEAGEAARICVLNGLSAAAAALGSLDPIAGVVQVHGFVASAPGFSLSRK